MFLILFYCQVFNTVLLPGFGDSVNNTNCWVPVTEYIENQFDQFLEAEQRVNRYNESYILYTLHSPLYTAQEMYLGILHLFNKNWFNIEWVKSNYVFISFILLIDILNELITCLKL